LLAKIASTIDVMSAGRLLCGLGAGWYEHEWRAYGYGFPEVPERMRAFREAVEIVVKMWTEEKPTYQGKFYTINEPINEPKGIQTPHIPLWLGGGGEKVTLKLVAKYAQACNVGGGDPVLVSQKLAILKEHCETLGRSYDAITKSTSINVFMLKPGEDAEQATVKVRGAASLEEYKKNVVVGTADAVMAKIDSLLAAGADYIIGYLPRVAYEPERVQQYADVLKQYA
jgi:alkanesulfonate monooxygenase SsuD/methylene tetrahydromethanopterin reductase-like flavin-dependent oxidoreductase (luciferase family)